MATPINLAIASPAVIKAWCKSIQVGCLNDSFESKKIIPENKELCDVALKVYTMSMGPMECCTVTTGPGSGGSGGSDGPMAIMGSKYADVIGSVDRVGILLRIFLTRPWPVL